MQLRGPRPVLRCLLLGMTATVALASCAGAEDEGSRRTDDDVGVDGAAASSRTARAPDDVGSSGGSRSEEDPTGGEGASRRATPRPTPSVTPVPQPGEGPTAVAPDVPQAWLDAAREAAVRATGSASADPVADAVVTGAVLVTWDDGSLGCPEPGVTYTMAPVDGARAIVTIGDEVLDVRLDDRGRAVVCTGTGAGGGAPTS